MGLQAARLGRGWSQGELAARSGVPRATISAIENGRVVPSVEAALALARALDTTVELLFAPSSIDAWIAPASDRFYVARVGDRIVGIPLEPLLAGPPFPDGAFESGVPAFDATTLDRTLVIATCDPAVSILRDALADRWGIRLIALARSSRDALHLLDRGLVHAAGIHFATSDDPESNRTAAPDHTLIRAGTWDVGLAHAHSGAITVDDLIRPDASWVNRPLGSGARACLDRVLDAAPIATRPKHLDRVARDHRAVADIIASGFAEAGVSLRLAAEERRLGFLSLETALYDVAIREELLEDRRGRALIETIQSPSFQRALGMLPGIEAGACGEIDRAS